MILLSYTEKNIHSYNMKATLFLLYEWEVRGFKGIVDFPHCKSLKNVAHGVVFYHTMDGGSLLPALHSLTLPRSLLLPVVPRKSILTQTTCGHVIMPLSPLYHTAYTQGRMAPGNLKVLESQEVIFTHSPGPCKTSWTYWYWCGVLKPIAYRIVVVSREVGGVCSQMSKHRRDTNVRCAL